MNRLLVAAATACFVFSLTGHAQTPAPVQPLTQSPVISPEKRALAKELADAMGVKKQATEVLTSLEAELSKMTVDMTWSTLSAMPEMKVLTEAERQDLEKQLREDGVKQNQRMIDAITSKIDYGQLLEDVSVVVYTKYFSEKELTDLIAFYKSDTGKRSMQLLPNMMVDTMHEASDRLIPVMNDVVRDIADEDTKKMRDKVTALARAHHSQTTSKRKPR